MLVVLFVLFYQKRLLNQKMKLQEVETQFQRELIQSMLETQEKERTRIAKDLHDDLGALLTATRQQAQQLQRYYAEGDPGKPFVDLTNELLQESISSVRSISRDLIPIPLQRFGLVAALEELAERCVEPGKRKITIRSSNPEQRFAPNTELNLFRIGQELINNSIKHAEASHLILEISETADSIVVTYTDNGKGFDSKAVKRGVGMNNLNSRVEMLSGTIVITSQQGNGIQVKLNIPKNSNISAHDTTD